MHIPTGKKAREKERNKAGFPLLHTRLSVASHPRVSASRLLPHHPLHPGHSSRLSWAVFCTRTSSGPDDRLGFLCSFRQWTHTHTLYIFLFAHFLVFLTSLWVCREQDWTYVSKLSTQMLRFDLSTQSLTQRMCELEFTCRKGICRTQGNGAESEVLLRGREMTAIT